MERWKCNESIETRGLEKQLVKLEQPRVNIKFNRKLEEGRRLKCIKRLAGEKVL